MFPTFCPKAVAGIGTPPDTVADRSIPIRLKRRTKDEPVKRFRLRDRGVKEDAEKIKERATKWAAENEDTLREAWPELPDELTDRQQDAAEPLLAIADLAGEGWDDRARRALVEVFTEGAGEDLTLRVRLLADIKECIDGHHGWIKSENLVVRLAQTDPWNGSDGQKPLTAKKLGWMLGHFDVHAKQHRFDDGERARGYEVGKLRGAWERYVPDEGDA